MRHLRTLRSTSILLASLLAPAAAAQSFTDGDLVLATYHVGDAFKLHRIAPETGVSTLLVDDVNPNAYGGIAFDPYRGKLVACYGFWSLPLGGAYQVVTIDASGTVVPLGYPGSYHGLAPTGDGRVFLQDGVLNPTHVRYLDASNQMHTLLDAATGLPFEHAYYHAIYDPASNALITSGANSAAACGPGDIRFTRLQLSANGTQVLSSFCTSYDLPSNEASCGFDRLPDGALLAAASHAYIGTEALLRIDPLTLAITVWANPTPISFAGTPYSQRLGKAVVFDVGNSALKTFSQSQSGNGDPLAVDVPVNAGGLGIGPFQMLLDINLFGPGCGGLAEQFGAGSPGTGGFVPQLAAGSCPRIGSALPLQISNAVGGGVGTLALGYQQIALPAFGGTLYLLPVLTAPFALSGSPGAAGQGQATKVLFYPNDPSLIGVPIYLQAGVLDAGAASGVTLTNGLEVRAG